MRIGMVTFWNSKDNYGQQLQLFALQEVLRKLEFEPFLIKYDRNLDKIRRNVFNYLNPSAWSRFFRRFFKAEKKCLEPENHVDRHFDVFQNKYIKSTCEVYSKEDLLEFPPEAEVYLTGSDQVWRKPSDVYFLNFGKSGIKRVSYAASFGRSWEDYSRRDLAQMKKLVSRMDAISVRELDGLDICQKMGRSDARYVVDPTMLLTERFYCEKFNLKKKNKSAYCLVYYLGSSDLLPIQMINEFAEKNKLEVRYIGAHGQTMGYKKIYPTIEEWVDLIKDADFVITNSFHGTVFSILMHTNFCAVPGAHSNVRLFSLLKRFDLMNHLYNGCLDQCYSDALNIIDIDNRLETFREDGIKYLKESING